MKALIDRVGFVGLGNKKMFRNKVGAVISCFRRSGAVHTIETMNHLFFSNEFVIAGRAICVARDKGDVEKDEKGIQMARGLGQRMSWIMKRLYAERS
jgi:multimeric flavodoxin WrbA